MTPQTLEVLVKRDFADKISSDNITRELTKDFADNKEIVKILTSELNQGGMADFISNMRNYIEFSKEQAPKIDVSKALNEKDPDVLEAKVLQALNHFEKALVRKAMDISQDDPYFMMAENMKNGKIAGFALVSREPSAGNAGAISFNRNATSFVVGYIQNNPELLKAISAKELENDNNSMKYQNLGNELGFVSEAAEKNPEIFLREILFLRTDLPKKLNEGQFNAMHAILFSENENVRSQLANAVKNMEKPDEYIVKFMKELTSMLAQEDGSYEKKALINAFVYNKEHNLVKGIYRMSEKINNDSSIEEIKEVTTRMMAHFTEDMFTKMKDHVEKNDPEINLDIKNRTLILKIGDTELDLGKSPIYEVVNTLRQHSSELKNQSSELNIDLREMMGIKKPELGLER